MTVKDGGFITNRFEASDILFYWQMLKIPSTKLVTNKKGIVNNNHNEDKMLGKDISEVKEVKENSK